VNPRSITLYFTLLVDQYYNIYVYMYAYSIYYVFSTCMHIHIYIYIYIYDYNIFKIEKYNDFFCILL